MRYLRVTLRQDEGIVHPMHEFVVEREGYGPARLIHWNPAAAEINTMIFRVAGDPDPYAEALAERERVVDFEVSPGRRRAFFVYVRERLTESERRLTAAFTKAGVVVLPPVEYRTDGTIGVTLVGPADQLQRTVDESPESIDVDVDSVGRYGAGRIDGASDLTDRQFRAVEIAVDAGYYDTPREATVDDVAAELGCSAGTAAEHLRKAEATIMSRAIAPEPRSTR